MNVTIQDAGWCKEMSIRVGIIPRLRFLSLAPIVLSRSKEPGLELWSRKTLRWCRGFGTSSRVGFRCAVVRPISIVV